MANEARQMTCKVIEMAQEGVLSWEMLARDCLNYMSEAEVQDMTECYHYFDFDEDNDE
jgi:hypothetical protein